eukprot:403374923
MERFLISNKFFANLKNECDREAILECFKAMTIEEFKQKDTVFNFGDYGNEFFIILQGKVSVQVPTLVNMTCNYRELINFMVENFDCIMWKKIDNWENLKTSAEYEKKARQFKDYSILSQIANEVNQSIQSYQVWLLKEVVQFSKGQSFGELALITSKPRAATIICLESTDLVILDKQSYDKVVGKAFRRKVNEKVEFLKQFRILAHIQETQLQRLTYYFQEQKCNRSQLIYKCGMKNDGVYFIKSGEFELIREINIEQQLETFIQKARQTDMTMGQRLQLKKQTKMKRDQSINKIRVAILGMGEVFGIEESQDEKRMNTVICNQNDSVVYFMPIEDFKERVIGDRVLQDIEVENKLKQIFYKFRKAQIKFFGKAEQENPISQTNSQSISETPISTLKIKDYYKQQNQMDYQNIIKSHLVSKGSLRTSIDNSFINDDDVFVQKFMQHYN